MKFAKIEPVIQEVVDCAVAALPRFCRLTDLGPGQMPESYMQNRVFDRLGTKHCFAPELTVRMLWKWRHSIPLPDGVSPQQRFDLTLFEPMAAPKSEWPPWCFLEFSRYDWNKVDKIDYEKLKRFCRLLKCPFGFAAGILPDTAANTREWMAEEATKLGEHFVVSRDWAYSGASRRRPFVVAGWLFGMDP